MVSGLSTGVDIFLKAPDAKFFLAAQGTFRALKAQASLGGISGGGGGIFKIEHSETLFSVFLEPKIQFPRQLAGVHSNSEK